jgi:hypothetical protein
MSDQHTRRSWNIPKISLFVASTSLIVSLIGLCFIIANYNIQVHADRPFVRATGADLAGTADPDTYTLAVALYNSGKEDARDITIKTAMIDPITKQPKLTASEQFSRLRASLPYAYQAKFSIRKTDTVKFFVFCVTYTDDASNHYEPEATFMTFPAWPASNGQYACLKSDYRGARSSFVRLLLRQAVGLNTGPRFTQGLISGTCGPTPPLVPLRAPC